MNDAVWTYLELGAQLGNHLQHARHHGYSNLAQRARARDRATICSAAASALTDSIHDRTYDLARSLCDLAGDAANDTDDHLEFVVIVLHAHLTSTHHPLPVALQLWQDGLQASDALWAADVL